MDNPYNIDLEGVDATITYDENILSPLDATFSGTVLENENYGIQVNTVTDSSISVWIYANGDLFAGEGIISFLNFAVGPNAVHGEESELNFTFAEVNEYPVDTTDGLFTVVGIYDVFGNIAYYSNNNPIEHATVNLASSKPETATNQDGDYEFLEIPYGDYTSSVYKLDDLGGLSSMDASRIARYGVGLFDLTDYEIAAADVSLNASVSPLDASRVARYGVGLIDSLNDEEVSWVFLADSLDSTTWPPITYETKKYYEPLDFDMYDQDFVGVRLGDVTGNWTPSKNNLILGAKTITASLPDTIGQPSQIVTTPINVYDLEDMEGVELTITFDEQVIDALDATLDGGILENENFGYQINTGNDNELVLWLYTLGDPYSGGGTLANIDFEVVGTIDDSTDLNFENFTVNEIDYTDNAVNGSLLVVSNNINGNEIPTEVFMDQNCPNPVKNSTKISFGLINSSTVDISIYNLKGQLVSTVIQSNMEAGYHSADLSLKNLPSGIYFYRMKIDGTIKGIKKMV